jgi:Na+/H+ antiporter NhaD/arsenite permease-like protein
MKSRSGPQSLGAALVALVVASALAAAILGGNATRIAAAAVFSGSYVALAIGRVPGLSIDRAGIALVGAALMVASGAIPIEDAYRSIDFGTITLLLGMMIVVANLRLSGFFVIAADWVVARAQRPGVLLVATVTISGVFSAFLVNDAICLVLTPLVLAMARALGRRPLPYLLAVAMASNAGSTATITGNPQNIMIGSVSQIPYARFAFTLGPVALAALGLTVVLIALAHQAEFAAGAHAGAPPMRHHANPVLAARALGAAALVIALCFAGIAPAKAAIVIGGLLLLTRRVKSRRIYREIDWSLLLMFVGLFIIVAGAERSLLTGDRLDAAGRLHLAEVPVLAVTTAILSNLVSNVPAVLMLKPVVMTLGNRDTAWLVVAMASTLAGNFSVLGSVANLIVVQRAAQSGVVIGFWDYFRVGAPLTILTLMIGILWLWL